MKRLSALFVFAASPAVAATGPFFSLHNTDFVVTLAFLLFVGVLLLAREMAVHISPRPGFTRHRLTLHAADEMLSLVDRARRFRSAPPP